jgi:hypothetical protein
MADSKEVIAARNARIKELEARELALLNDITKSLQKEYLKKAQGAKAKMEQHQHDRRSWLGQSTTSPPVASSGNWADPVSYTPGGMYHTDQPSFSVPSVDLPETPLLQGHTLAGSSVPRMNPDEVASLIYAQQQLHAEGITLPEHTPETGSYAQMRNVDAKIPLRDPVRRQVAEVGTPYGIPETSSSDQGPDILKLILQAVMGYQSPRK